MSIMKGFEERRTFPRENGPAMFYWDDVGHLLRHARSLETMLKKHEWPDLDDGYHHPCPECKRLERDGHALDCEWAKLVEGVE